MDPFDYSPEPGILGTLRKLAFQRALVAVKHRPQTGSTYQSCWHAKGTNHFALQYFLARAHWGRRNRLRHPQHARKRMNFFTELSQNQSLTFVSTRRAIPQPDSPPQVLGTRDVVALLAL